MNLAIGLTTQTTSTQKRKKPKQTIKTIERETEFKTDNDIKAYLTNKPKTFTIRIKYNTDNHALFTDDYLYKLLCAIRVKHLEHLSSGQDSPDRYITPFNTQGFHFVTNGKLLHIYRQGYLTNDIHVGQTLDARIKIITYDFESNGKKIAGIKIKVFRMDC